MSATPGSIFQTSIGGTGQTSLTQSFTVTAGASLCCFVGGPSGTTWSVSSTLSGSFGAAKAGITTVGGGGVGVFTLDGATGGSDTITVTPNGGTSTAFIGMAAFQVTTTSGYDANSPFAVSSAGTTTRSSANVTPTLSGAIVGFLYNDTQNNSGGVDTGNGFAAMTGSGVTGGHFWAFSSGNNFAWLETKTYGTTTPLPATFISVTGGSATGTLAILFKDATADVTVALTGQRATFTPGIMTQSGGITPTVSTGVVLGPGNPALSSPTNSLQFATLRSSPQITSNVTVGLSGQMAIFTAGLLGVDHTLALTGQSALFTAGTMGASSGTDVTVGLVGQLALFTPGQMLANLSLPLTGQRSTFATGTMTNGLTVFLAGKAATFMAGNMAPSGGAPVTGPQVTLVGFIANMGSLMGH